MAAGALAPGSRSHGADRVDNQLGQRRRRSARATRPEPRGSPRRAGADALPGVASTRLAGLRVVALDETRNWGETERELLLRTHAEVVMGCWSQSAPDMCDSHTRTRHAKPADNALSAAPPRAKAKRHASISSVRPGAYARPGSFDGRDPARPGCFRPPAVVTSAATGLEFCRHVGAVDVLAGGPTRPRPASTPGLSLGRLWGRIRDRGYP